MTAYELGRTMGGAAFALLPLAICWLIGGRRAKRHAEPERRRRVRRHYLGVGAVLSALLAIPALSSALTRLSEQPQDRFFTTALRGCVDECTIQGNPAFCGALCGCYIEELRATLTRDQVFDLIERLGESRGNQAAIDEVLFEQTPEIGVAASRCLGSVPVPQE